MSTKDKRRFNRCFANLLSRSIAQHCCRGLVLAGQEKVTVCHKPGAAEEATLEIAAPAEATHLAHGDYSGECAPLNEYIPDPQFTDVDYCILISNLDYAIRFSVVSFISLRKRNPNFS